MFLLFCFLAMILIFTGNWIDLITYQVRLGEHGPSVTVFDQHGGGTRGKNFFVLSLKCRRSGFHHESAREMSLGVLLPIEIDNCSMQPVR